MKGDPNDPANPWHHPNPGPAYWDFRCLTCDRPISEHPTLWQYIKYRWFGRAS